MCSLRSSFFEHLNQSIMISNQREYVLCPYVSSSLKTCWISYHKCHICEPWCHNELLLCASLWQLSQNLLSKCCRTIQFGFCYVTSCELLDADSIWNFLNTHHTEKVSHLNVKPCVFQDILYWGTSFAKFCKKILPCLLLGVLISSYVFEHGGVDEISMRHSMNISCLTAIKLIVANVATKWFFSCMGPFVCIDRFLSITAILTKFTLENFLSMSPFMLIEFVLSFVKHATMPTFQSTPSFSFFHSGSSGYSDHNSLEMSFYTEYIWIFSIHLQCEQGSCVYSDLKQMRTSFDKACKTNLVWVVCPCAWILYAYSVQRFVWRTWGNCCI